MQAIKDPKTGKLWKIERFKEIKRVNADVYARWVVNCIVPAAELKEMINIDFLEPHPVKGQAVLSLCAIFMRHAAPAWMPLKIGPGSQNCALRIACTDTRDGSPAVWVGSRHTDSFLAPALALLGFPAVKNDLKVTENTHLLNFETEDNSLECRLKKIKTKTKRSRLFDKDSDFDNYFCAGIRSYSNSGKHTEIIDLYKLKDNHFTAQQMRGFLNTEYGCWPLESAFLTEDGLYQWVYEGRV